jgi:hypothetical protein
MSAKAIRIVQEEFATDCFILGENGGNGGAECARLSELSNRIIQRLQKECLEFPVSDGETAEGFLSKAGMLIKTVDLYGSNGYVNLLVVAPFQDIALSWHFGDFALRDIPMEQGKPNWGKWWQQRTLLIPTQLRTIVGKWREMGILPEELPGGSFEENSS